MDWTREVPVTEHKILLLFMHLVIKKQRGCYMPRSAMGPPENHRIQSGKLLQ